MGCNGQNMNSLVRFSVGQVWQTSRGYLWHVVEITTAGQAVLRLGGDGRKRFQTTPPRRWTLLPNGSSELGHSQIECPLKSIEATIAFSPHDWSAHHRMAWIYGITCGWDNDLLEDMIKKHGWKPETVDRLKRLHAKWESLKANMEANNSRQPSQSKDLLLDAAQALDDCLIRIYPEEFTSEHVEAASQRFYNGGGTISRIAKIADELRQIANSKAKCYKGEQINDKNG